MHGSPLLRLVNQVLGSIANNVRQEEVWVVADIDLG